MDGPTEVCMSEGDLENAALLFGALKALHQRLPGGEERGAPLQADEALTSVFDKHIQAVMTKLAAELESRAGASQRQAAILDGKVALFSVCWDLLVETTSALDTTGSLGRVVARLHAVVDELFATYSTVVSEQQRSLDEQSVTAELIRTASADASRVAALEEELRLVRKQNDALSTLLHRQLLQHPGGAPVGVVDPRAGPAQATAGAPDSSTSSSSAARSPAPAGAPSAAAGVASSSNRHRLLPLRTLLTSIDALYASKAKHDAVCDLARQPRETMEQHLYTWLRGKFGLKTLIQENAASIIRSTGRYAGVNGDVATFRAILRNTVDEDFTAVQRALKDAAREGLRVHLRSGPHRLGQDVADMLADKTHPTTGLVTEEEWGSVVRRLYGPSDAAALTGIVREEVARHAVAASLGLDLHERFNALLLVASEEDEAFQAHVAAEAAVASRVGGMGGGEIASLVSVTNPSGHIFFSDFTRCLLNFQLSGHTRFLSKFHAAFRELDVASSGVLSVEAWARLVALTAPHLHAAEAGRVAAAADPHGTGVVTFTSAVAALSTLAPPGRVASPPRAAPPRSTGGVTVPASVAAAALHSHHPPAVAYKAGGGAADGRSLSASSLR